MALKYFATVHDLTVRAGGKEKLVRKGDAAPDNIDEVLRDALVRTGLLTASEAPRRGSVEDTATSPDPGPIVVDPSQLPADRDSRAVWEAFGAQVLGLSSAEAKALKTKDELVAEITNRFNAAQEPVVAPDGAPTV